MDEEALSDAYNLFKDGGYNGTIDDYKSLISSDNSALSDSFKLFSSSGYEGSIDDFSSLIGVKKKDNTESSSDNTSLDSPFIEAPSSEAKYPKTVENSDFEIPNTPEQLATNIDNLTEAQRRGITDPSAQKLDFKSDSKPTKDWWENDLETLSYDEWLKKNDRKHDDISSYDFRRVELGIKKDGTNTSSKDYSNYLDGIDSRKSISFDEVSKLAESLTEFSKLDNNDLLSINKHREDLASGNQGFVKDFMHTVARFGSNIKNGIPSEIRSDPKFITKGEQNEFIRTEHQKKIDLFIDGLSEDERDALRVYKEKENKTITKDMNTSLKAKYLYEEGFKGITNKLDKLKEAMTLTDDETNLSELRQVYSNEVNKAKENIQQYVAVSATINKLSDDYLSIEQEYDMTQRDYNYFSNANNTFKDAILGAGDNLGHFIEANATYLMGATNYKMMTLGLLKPLEFKAKEDKREESKSNELNKWIKEAEAKDVKDSKFRRKAEFSHDFGAWLTDLALNQSVVLAQVSIPYVGLSMVSAEAAGQKLVDIARDGEKTSESEALWASWLYGGSEYITEKITLGIIKNQGRVFNKIMKDGVTLPAARIGIKSAINTLGSSVYASQKEGISEAINSVMQNAVDKYVLNKKNVDLWDNWFDNYIGGAVMGFGMTGFGQMRVEYAKRVAIPKNRITVKNNVDKILELKKALQDVNITDVNKDIYVKKITKLINENSKIINTGFDSFKNLSEKDNKKVQVLSSLARGVEVSIEEEVNPKLKIILQTELDDINKEKEYYYNVSKFQSQKEDVNIEYFKKAKKALIREVGTEFTKKDLRHKAVELWMEDIGFEFNTDDLFDEFNNLGKEISDKEKKFSKEELLKDTEYLESKDRMSDLEDVLKSNDIKETNDAAAYSKAITEAKELMKKGKKRLDLQVDDVTEKDAQEILYGGGKLFLSSDGLFGGYVKSDGYMGGLFKNPQSIAKSVSAQIQEARVAEGGKFFDAYGTHLEDIYIKNGFRPLYRMDFDESKAPEGWDSDGSPLKNKPDNVFFVYDPKGSYKVGDGTRVTNYKEAYEASRDYNEKNGKQNEKFFTDKAKKPSSSVKYKPVIKINNKSVIAKAFQKFTMNGNFTGHISKMIAGFAEKQQRVAEAIFAGKFKSFLDIGASEGGLVKTVASTIKGMRAVAVDPNSEMKKNFNKTEDVDGAEFVQKAFQGSWIEDDGTVIEKFKSKDKYQVINEDFTFQFINNNREGQVKEVKSLLEKDGIFVTSEKFHTKNSVENEKKKLDHQRKYFKEDEITEDKQTIVSGMAKDMVSDTEYVAALKKYFKYVEEFWNAGDFKGYIASDNKSVLDKFKRNIGNLDSEFTDYSAEEQTINDSKNDSPIAVEDEAVKIARELAETHKRAEIIEYLKEAGFSDKIIKIAVTKGFVKNIITKSKGVTIIKKASVGLRVAMKKIAVAYNKGGADKAKLLKEIKKRATKVISKSLSGKVNLIELKSLITRVRDINEKNFDKKMSEIFDVLNKIERRNYDKNYSLSTNKLIKKVRKKNDKGDFDFEKKTSGGNFISLFMSKNRAIRAMVDRLTRFSANEIPENLRGDYVKVVSSLDSYRKTGKQPMFDSLSDLVDKLEDTFINKKTSEEALAELKLSEESDRIQEREEKKLEEREIAEISIRKSLDNGYNKEEFEDNDRMLLFKLFKFTKRADFDDINLQTLKEIAVQLKQVERGSNSWMPRQEIVKIVMKFEAKRIVRGVKSEVKEVGKVLKIFKGFAKATQDIKVTSTDIRKEIEKWNNKLPGYAASASGLFKRIKFSHGHIIGAYLAGRSRVELEQLSFSKRFNQLLKKVRTGTDLDNKLMLALYSLQKRYDGNINNSKVFSAGDHYRATLEFAEKYNESTEDLERIFEKFSKDGEIDLAAIEKVINSDKAMTELVMFINQELGFANRGRKEASRYFEDSTAEDLDWYTPIVPRNTNKLSDLLGDVTASVKSTSIGSANKSLKAQRATPLGFDYFREIKSHIDHAIEYRVMMPIMKQLDYIEGEMNTSDDSTIKDWARIVFGAGKMGGIIRQNIQASGMQTKKSSELEQFISTLATNKIRSLLLSGTRFIADWGVNKVMTKAVYGLQMQKSRALRVQNYSGKGRLDDNKWMSMLFSNYNSEQAGRSRGVHTSEVKGFGTDYVNKNSFNTNKRTVVQYINDIMAYNLSSRTGEALIEDYYSVTDNPSMEVWKAFFTKEFPTFDANRFMSDLSYRELYDREIKAAIIMADDKTKRTYNSPSTSAQKTKAIIAKKSGILGQANHLLLGFKYNDYASWADAMYSLNPFSSKGALDGKEAMQLATIISTRQIAYTAIQAYINSYLVSAFVGFSPEDDDIDRVNKILPRTLAQFASFMVVGNKGAFKTMAYEAMFEVLNKAQSEYRETDYERVMFRQQMDVGQLGLTGMIVEDLMFLTDKVYEIGVKKRLGEELTDKDLDIVSQQRIVSILLSLLLGIKYKIPVKVSRRIKKINDEL